MKNLFSKLIQLKDRLLRSPYWAQLLLLFALAFGVFFAVAYLLMRWSGLIGYAQAPEGHALWQLYYYFADPGNQMSMENPPRGGRLVGALVSLLGSCFLGGLLISTFSNIISQRVDKINRGTAYYRFSGHTVIIGSDRMLHGIIRQLLEQRRDRIVVMTTTDVERLRESIKANLSDTRQMRRIVVNFGARDSEDYLNKIRITRAREVFILGDTSEFDDIENYHDTLNIQCLNYIAQLCEQSERRDKLTCHVAFEYQSTYGIFQYADLKEETLQHIDFHPFNPYDQWAEKVLVSGESKKNRLSYPSLDRGLITTPDSDRYVHFIVIGLSRMGQAMARMAALTAHYPNYRTRKTRITIIDRNCRAEMDEFKQQCGALFDLCPSTFIDCSDPDHVQTHPSPYDQQRYGHIAPEPFLDIEWQFIQGADSNPAVRRLLEQYAADEQAIVTVAICLKITHISLSSAMHLPSVYYQKQIPVHVQQRNSSALVTTLGGTLYANLRPFGMVYDSCSLDAQRVHRWAQSIHEAYRSEYPTLPPWEELSVVKQWSNLYAAYALPTKQRCCQGLPAGQRAPLLASAEHNRWMLTELLLGWRPTQPHESGKSNTHRYHHDIRPFESLSEQEQKKDHFIINQSFQILEQ